MCSINGATRRDRELIERMNAATAHRGPDGTGVYERDEVTFGHNRLAIIDTSERGAQPMQSADGSLVITYNGELYNYRELRRELAGYPFMSESDTEVILAAYARWGVACLERFNGIFAFGLWDDKKKELLLARDPMGVKPLYYFLRDGVVFFSSEIKALLEGGVSRTLDYDGFSCFMRIAAAPEPHTLLRDVKKLPSAHYVRVKGGTFTLVKYWDEGVRQQQYRPVREWQERIRETLERAVTRQLVSDRPVGVYLSGGIDSSAILASVVRAEGAARTYTVRFEVESAREEEKFNRDAVLAQQTASFFGTEHSEITLLRRDIVPLFERAMWHLDGPSRSATAIAQLALARETVRDVTVVLGGDGGDELFGGYERYRLSRVMDLYQRLPESVRALSVVHSTLTKLNVPPGIERFAQFYFLKQRELDRVLTPPFRADYAFPFFAERFFASPNTPFLEALLRADLHVLTDGSLLRTDKLSMAVGLEARVPLLDKELIELAAQIPAAQKVSLFKTKKLFKDAVRSYLPSYLFKEPKRGWFAPSGMWLHQPDFYAYAKEVLSPSYYAATKPLFDWNGIAVALEEHYTRARPNRPLLWALLSFQVWARQYRVEL